jgi:hypothetical protein
METITGNWYEDQLMTQDQKQKLQGNTSYINVMVKQARF